MPHLFVDISAHGLGHLAQVAPVLNALGIDGLQLTIRSELPQERLQTRIQRPFTHLHGASDFGFVMHDALRIDLEASAQRYRMAHENWQQRVGLEAEFLRSLAPDLVLTDVAYLPLAGAASAGIPSLAMSSLNWADLFAHYFGQEAWADAIHQQILAAYQSAHAFLRVTPGMPMESLSKRIIIGPIASGTDITHKEAAQRLNLPLNKRWVMVALGGIEHRLPAENWPVIDGIHWLLPAAWQVQRSDASHIDEGRLPFADLLPNVDAILTKPGYGTFTEAACNGVPVLYLRRPDWPEEPCLIEWLQKNNRALEIDNLAVETGKLAVKLGVLWALQPPLHPYAKGISEARDRIETMLADRSA